MTNPTPADFRAYFTRDFPYGSTTDKVMDSDIQKAIDQADINFNSALWSTQAKYTIGFLYLTAHYLVMSLRASSQGIAGQYNWMTTSKSVGSVSEGFQIPQWVLDHPLLGMYSKSTYGARYLELVIPQLVGQTFTVCGRTQP